MTEENLIPVEDLKHLRIQQCVDGSFLVFAALKDSKLDSVQLIKEEDDIHGSIAKIINSPLVRWHSKES